MASAPDRSQKTEEPTPRRKKEARERGQVARSSDVITWASVLVASFVLPGVVHGVFTQLLALLQRFRDVAADPLEPDALAGVGHGLASTFTAVLPLMLGAAGVAVLASVAQTGLLLSPKVLKPKAERISPAKGFKRIFSVRSLWETAKQVIKLLVITLVATPVVVGVSRSLGAGRQGDLRGSLTELATASLLLVRLVALIALVIAAADYAFQRNQHRKDLRMTKQELRQELRDAEGDPHLKAKVRSMRLAMSRNRMIGAVSDADVVITNPTHVAVALRYDSTRGAPRVVAKGIDAVALRVREAAADADVPVVESPPLARALYAVCRLDQEIPRELFQAVATVLAFVHRLGRRRALGGAFHLHVPDTWTPAGLEVRELAALAGTDDGPAPAPGRRAPSPEALIPGAGLPTSGAVGRERQPSPAGTPGRARSP